MKIKEFYNDSLAGALRECQKEHKAMFMPELAKARIQGKVAWDKWFSTPSIRATGKTKQGNAVVVYAHIPNYFSNPDNIDKAVKEGLVNGAGRMPEKEFYGLLEKEDGSNVFVVNYNDLRKSTSGAVPLADAMKHPQTIPFLGGEKTAEAYLKKFKEAYGRNEIGIWHCDDLEESPLGRLLYVNDGYGGDLYGSYLYDYGRFAGVGCGTREPAKPVRKTAGTSPRISRPSLSEVMKYSKGFVAPNALEDFRKGLKGLYKK